MFSRRRIARRLLSEGTDSDPCPFSCLFLALIKPRYSRLTPALRSDRPPGNQAV